MLMQANFMDIYLQGMRDRSMRSGTELAREIKLTDWSMAANLSNRSSGVQIPRDICTRLKRYLYSAKCSWIINICHTCLVLATLLRSCQDLPSPLEYVTRKKRGYAATRLRGYAVVKTSPTPQNMIVTNEVTTRLRARSDCVAS